MTKGMRVGYIRVSTIDQNTDRQLENVNLDKVFTDKASGKDTNRPEFESMMNFVREGDHVIIHSMDRLGRNLAHLKATVDLLTGKGVTVEFSKERLIFNGDDSPMSKLFFHLMAALAEFDYQLIRERQKEGIAIAKAKGVYKGRRRCLNSDQIKQMKDWLLQGMKKTWIAQQLNISRASVYEYLKCEV